MAIRVIGRSGTSVFTVDEHGTEPKESENPSSTSVVPRVSNVFSDRRPK